MNHLQDQHYRRYLIHILVVLIFLAYLASANYIFCYLLTVDGEARICDIDIPIETGDIRYSIDSVETQKIDWKNMIVIKGWAFIEGTDAYNSSTYIVLKKGTEEFIFDTKMKVRPDVTQYFNATQLDLNESGFQSNIPLECVSDGTHRIGIIICKDGTSRAPHYVQTAYIAKDGINVELRVG